ncbi:hypothetical protein BDZ89DRAFT_1131393 [Hymenopellis radicata]|nr:hypothetical protein BDZ89DRAFT_1131393 [Hymenopellis radicata]
MISAAPPAHEGSEALHDEPWILVDVTEQPDEVRLARECVGNLKKVASVLHLISTRRMHWGHSARIWELEELRVDARRGEELQRLLKECNEQRIVLGALLDSIGALD